MERNFYTKLSYRFTSDFVPYIIDYFRDVKRDLKRADINISLREYISVAVFSSMLGFVFTVPIISVFVGLLVGGISGVISGLIASLFIGVFIATGIFVGFYVYPSVRVNSREKSINNTLPFATLYLSTIAGTGTPPSALFELLGNFKEYGEISKEARKISRDVHSFGADIGSALKRAADRTPSSDFRELLWGMHNIISTGGDLKAFLRESSKSYMRQYRRNLDKFSKTLSLLVEIYITLVIVGSVFLMVISAIMSPFGVSPTLIIFLQLGGVFLFLPMASVMFIVVVKGASPMS